VETLFGKMTRTFLRQIRVQSRAELKERILLGIAEINEMPVVHRWKASNCWRPARRRLHKYGYVLLKRYTSYLAKAHWSRPGSRLADIRPQTVSPRGAASGFSPRARGHTEAAD
jgi:hypothetical protein